MNRASFYATTPMEEDVMWTFQNDVPTETRLDAGRWLGGALLVAAASLLTACGMIDVGPDSEPPERRSRGRGLPAGDNADEMK